MIRRFVFITFLLALGLTPAVTIPREVFSQAGISIEIFQPSEGFATREDRVIISGRVIPFDAIVTINQTRVPTVEDGRFEGVASLVEGVNQIVVRAETVKGERAEKTMRVVRDTTAPVIKRLDPTDGSIRRTARPSRRTK